MKISTGIRKIVMGREIIEKPIGISNSTYLTLDFTDLTTLKKTHYINGTPTGFEIITTNQYANIFLLDKNEHNITFKCDTKGTIMKVRVFK